MKRAICIILCLILLLCVTAAGAEQSVSAETQETVEDLLLQMEAAAETGDVLLANVLRDQIFRLGDQEASLRADELLIAAIEKKMGQAPSGLLERTDEPAEAAVTGTELLRRLVRMEKPEDVPMGEKAVLGDGLFFSVPVDWDSLPITEELAGADFVFKGVDEAGQECYFSGFAMPKENTGYQDAIHALEAQEVEYFFFQINGLDMLLTGNAEGAAGLCVQNDGKVIAFAFLYALNPYVIGSEAEWKGFSGLLDSEKLMKDMAAILFSAETADPAEYMKLADR